MTTRIGIAGCGGRVGRLLIRTVHETEGATLAAGSARPGGDTFGQDLGTLAGLGALGIAAGDSIETLFAASDVVIDFTSPRATLAHAAEAARTGRALVIGTTGIDADGRARLAEAAERAPILFSANMSLGINLLLGITRQVAAVLGDDFDIEIVEMHHRHKVDAPSGTALALAEAAATGRGVRLEDVADRGRDGATGARRRGAIGIAALRGGDVVGDHQVIFAAPGERIEIGHRASDRGIYARGAVAAALWLAGRRPGLYGMADVLGHS
jgi:4-hydroxy-tetrahydrodipicolinate reductase